MPTQLPTYAVRYRCDKFSTEAKFSTQFNCKLLWAVILFRHVPLKLISKRYVTNVDVQLEQHKTITNKTFKKPQFTQLTMSNMLPTSSIRAIYHHILQLSWFLCTLIITRWSSCSSRMLSSGNVSICWRIACEIAGKKCAGFRSRSSHNISANCSGVISCSAVHSAQQMPKYLDNSSSILTADTLQNDIPPRHVFQHCTDGEKQSCSIWHCSHYIITAQCYDSVAYVRPSIHLSATHPEFYQNSKHVIMQTMPHNSQSRHQRSSINSNGVTTNWGTKQR